MHNKYGKNGRPGSAGTRQFWEDVKGNNFTYEEYLHRLTELAISMFEWKNLPETVDPRFLELALFTDGMSVFFYDEEIGYLSLRTMIGGRMNVYQIPTERTAFASNGYNRKLNEENSVIIFNNLLHTNTMLEVYNAAQRLWEYDRTIDINVRAQKTPILILCDQNQRLTFENVYKQYDGNAPVIYGNNSLNPDSFKVLTTGAPFVSDKLYQLKTQYWNETLTKLGISNVNTQKKERLITDEVSRNQGGVVASRYSRLEARRQACNEINRMFGLDIWCDYRDDFVIPDFDGDISEEEGEEVNE